MIFYNLVGRQVQLADAGVGRRQLIRTPVVAVNLKLLCAVHSLQSSKTLKQILWVIICFDFLVLYYDKIPAAALCWIP